MTTTVTRGAYEPLPDAETLDEASGMVWRYRRRTGATPPPGITHARWVVSVARWLARIRGDAA